MRLRHLPRVFSKLRLVMLGIVVYSLRLQFCTIRVIQKIYCLAEMQSPTATKEAVPSSNPETTPQQLNTDGTLKESVKGGLQINKKYVERHVFKHPQSIIRAVPLSTPSQVVEDSTPVRKPDTTYRSGSTPRGAAKSLPGSAWEGTPGSQRDKSTPGRDRSDWTSTTKQGSSTPRDSTARNDRTGSRQGAGSSTPGGGQYRHQTSDWAKSKDDRSSGSLKRPRYSYCL